MKEIFVIPTANDHLFMSVSQGCDRDLYSVSIYTGLIRIENEKGYEYVVSNHLFWELSENWGDLYLL